MRRSRGGALADSDRARLMANRVASETTSETVTFPDFEVFCAAVECVQETVIAEIEQERARQDTLGKAEAEQEQTID